MKIPLSRIAFATALCGAAASWSQGARAQTATTTTETTATTPASAPQTNVYVQAQPAPATPTSTTTTTSGPVLVDPSVQRETQEDAYAPNTTLLASGILVFGLSYGTSVVVAASSDHDGDHHLYVPVVGPWLDMANRGSCPAGSAACDNETANKVLLAVDGVLQAAGALQIVGSLIFPQKRRVTTFRESQPSPKLEVTPARVGTGYGVGALLVF